MKNIPIIVLLALSCQAILSQQNSESSDPYPGLWLGVMQISEQMSMQLAFEIQQSENGAYSAKLNVIEQKAFDIPMDICEIKNDSIHIRFEAAGITYKGFYSRQEDKISGTYAQGGGQFTLNLHRVDKLITEVERPQTPVRPFPYDEEEVSFENEKAGISLAGTLTKPSGGTKLPAVVLIAGTGRNDRNQTSMGHFLLLSDYLTRQGYAVLRYDKRGVGQSGGDYGQATTYDFADDAESGMKYLASREDIDRSSIGFIGHSEGALIAPMIASGNKDVAYIIMMGGIGIQGKELLLLQSEKMAVINGVPREEIDEITEKNSILYDIAMQESNDSILVQKLREADPGITGEMLNMLRWDWFRTFLSLNPDEYLSKVECPVLGITGEKDVQCPPEENLAAMERSLQNAGNRHYELKSLEGLNHLFQTAETGSHYEYEQIAEIIAPDALKLMLDWMDQLAR
jgi:pimeloyl-ACP methyl ester carboxylesterase